MISAGCLRLRVAGMKLLVELPAKGKRRKCRLQYGHETRRWDAEIAKGLTRAEARRVARRHVIRAFHVIQLSCVLSKALGADEAERLIAADFCVGINVG